MRLDLRAPVIGEEARDGEEPLAGHARTRAAEQILGEQGKIRPVVPALLLPLSVIISE